MQAEKDLPQPLLVKEGRKKRHYRRPCFAWVGPRCMSGDPVKIAVVPPPASRRLVAML